LVLLAGLASSVGPCVAPRFIAVAALAANRPRREALGISLVFILGLASAYVGFGVVAALVGRLVAISHAIYAVVGTGMLLGGLISLWRSPSDCLHYSRASAGAPSFGATFLLGSSFALVVSPCCTPLLVGILAYTSGLGDPGYGAFLLGAFALGHSAPVLLAGAGASGVCSALRRPALRQAANVVNAALMVALAGYYAVIA
jgi:cytochrome c-type biogenesis protein